MAATRAACDRGADTRDSYAHLLTLVLVCWRRLDGRSATVSAKLVRSARVRHHFLPSGTKTLMYRQTNISKSRTVRTPRQELPVRIKRRGSHAAPPARERVRALLQRCRRAPLQTTPAVNLSSDPQPGDPPHQPPVYDLNRPAQSTLISETRESTHTHALTSSVAPRRPRLHHLNRRRHQTCSTLSAPYNRPHRDRFNPFLKFS